MRWRRLAAAAVALALAACGESTGGGGGQAGAGRLPALSHHVTVNFWHAMAGGTQKPTLEAITKAFNDSQPEVTVNLQVYPDYATLLQKTLAALAAGTPPTWPSATRTGRPSTTRAGLSRT
jgi:ABC-type glycerol-3-phosphate transport system substrate-binding protein